MKHHEGPPIGTVVSLDPSGEFGFLEASDGQEVYFHRNSVLDDAFSQLEIGSRVTFAEKRETRAPKRRPSSFLGNTGSERDRPVGHEPRAMGAFSP